MIEYRQGNLLEAGTEALVNTVNCVGVMGKGIALQFKLAFPENFRRYEQACRAGEVSLGQMLVVPSNLLAGPRYIINFPTKRHWRGKSRIQDIKAGLTALTQEIERYGIKSIALPPLGCGNGGLDWADVRPLIEEAFASMPNVRTIVFEPQGAPLAEAMPITTSRPPLTDARALLIRLMDLYQLPGYRLTLLEIQKLAYLLQSTGQPMRLNYSPGPYGPYAENLNFVLQKLEGHYIRGYGDRTGDAEIYLLRGAPEEARAFLQDNTQANDRLERVRRLIEGFESPYGMELLATVLWVVQEDPFAAENEDRAIGKVQDWSARKRSLFSRNHISAAWSRLRTEGWFEAAEVQLA